MICSFRQVSSLTAEDFLQVSNLSTFTTHSFFVFTPASSKIIKGFKFHTRFRKPGDSVTSYVSELRSIEKCCNFAGTL